MVCSPDLGLVMPERTHEEETVIVLDSIDFIEEESAV